MTAALLNSGLLERQMSFPHWLTAYAAKCLQVGGSSLRRPSGQELRIPKRFKIKRSLARADVWAEARGLCGPAVGLGGACRRVTCHCSLPSPPAVAPGQVIATGHEIVQREDLGTSGGGCRGGPQHLSCLSMQLAASLVGQPGVRDFPQQGMPKAELVICWNDDAFKPR